MAYICFNRLWEIEFDNIVSKNDKFQDMNLNQIKLEVMIPLKKRKKAKNFKPSNPDDVIKEVYLVEKMTQKMVTYHYWKKITTKCKFLVINSL